MSYLVPVLDTGPQKNRQYQKIHIGYGLCFCDPVSSTGTGYPVRYVEDFCKAGADIVTVHVEADTEENTRLALERVRALGKRAGVVLKPKTPAEAALPFLDQCAMVLVMTVEPGFGGQSFMEDMLEKVRTLRGWIGGRGLDCELEVDGGIGPRTAPPAVEAGANVLVAGSAVYGAEDIPARIAELRG